MKKNFFSFLITKLFFFQYFFSIYVILYILILNRKKFFKKKINVLVLSKDRFDKSNFIFEKLDNYNLLYLPVRIQSLLLTKWQSKLDYLSNKNLNNDKAKINFLNKNNIEIKRIRKDYLNLIYKIFPLVFRVLKIKILFSGSVHYIQDHDIATVAKSENIPFIIFHRENVFFTKAQIKYQKKQYENYCTSNADLIFVNNEETKDIIENTIGNKSKVIIISSSLNTKLVKIHKSKKKYITLFSFTNNYGLGALNYFKNSKRWDNLFHSVHLNFLKIVNKYPNERFLIKIKWSGGWLKSIEEIWYKNFKKNFPNNLKIINENQNSQSIINKSKFVISFNSTAILEAALVNKKVIVPNFAECKDKELGKFSFGNLKKAKLYFKVAETEKQFNYLIEKEIHKKNNNSKLGSQKKIFIKKIINPHENLIKLISQVDFYLKDLTQTVDTKKKMIGNDLCFFIKPKFYHMENVVPFMFFLNLNFKFKNKIQIVLSRIEDYKYLKSTRSVYNSVNRISKIDYLNSKKSFLNQIKNLFFYLKIFSKKRTFYIYKPGKLVQIFLKTNRFIFGSTINYYILNYDNRTISEPTLKIIKSLKTKDTNIADNIITNIPNNYFDIQFYKENIFKVINLKISRFSSFWINQILSEERKINTLIPQKSIFFPLSVLERKLYNKDYDFKLIISKILFYLNTKYKKHIIIFRPHPTTNTNNLKKYLNNIQFKRYKILYNHYYYLISKSNFSVRYLASTIDISHAILKKKLFRFYPKEIISKDKMIHNLEKKNGYNKFIYNFDYSYNTKKILKYLVK